MSESELKQVDFFVDGEMLLFSCRLNTGSEFQRFGAATEKPPVLGTKRGL